MNVQRGDVVLIGFRYRSGGAGKLRPALVVQNEDDNQRSVNTIVAQIAIATRSSLEPTQLLIEISSHAGQQAGLRQDCVVNCVNLLTLDKEMILRRLGSLPAPSMQKLDECLKVALGLP